MRKNRFTLLYAALALGAIYLVGNSWLNAPEPENRTEAPIADTSALTGPHPLAEGLIKKLSFHAEAKAPYSTEFSDPEGGSHTLAEYHGQYILVNMWATWCAPCRKEMPTLDRLQETLGGDDFQVVTIATGRNKVPGINQFFADANVTQLPVLLDPTGALAREMLVLGLPTTILINREGHEIARLRGDAEWDSDSAIAVLEAVIAD